MPLSSGTDSFIGREREMAELTAALDSALLGRGQLVMLVGDPGIGKTRIAEELANLAEQRGAIALWGRCPEERGAPPYWPWVQIIRAYLANRDAGEIQSAMGSGAGAIASIVAEVTDVEPVTGSPSQHVALAISPPTPGAFSDSSRQPQPRRSALLQRRGLLQLPFSHPILLTHETAPTI